MINTVRNMYDTFNVRLSEYVRDLIREYLSIFQRDRALNLACTHDLVIAKPKRLAIFRHRRRERKKMRCLTKNEFVNNKIVLDTH